jgi:hypothetical protein
MNLKPILNLFTVDKYYLMSDKDLQAEAAKWHIGSYAYGRDGIIERQIIIDALIKKDKANNSRISIILSILALVISAISIICK